MKNDIEEYHKLCPLGIIHFLLVYFRGSSQRMDDLRACAKEAKIEGLIPEDFNEHIGFILDNATRWNSTYLAAKRAMALRQAIEKFLQKKQLTSQ